MVKCDSICSIYTHRKRVMLYYVKCLNYNFPMTIDTVLYFFIFFRFSTFLVGLCSNKSAPNMP